MTNEDIIGIRDAMLPNRGEAFDCLAFARAIEARSAIRLLPTDGAMTPERFRAFHRLEALMIEGLEAAKAAGVAQGLIVAILHGHAHAQTASMMQDA